MKRVGVNNVVFAGNVGEVNYTYTNLKKDPVLGFGICCEDMDGFTVWLRATIYGIRAEKMKDIIKTGQYVTVVGKLINRRMKLTDTITTELKVTGDISIG